MRTIKLLFCFLLFPLFAFSEHQLSICAIFKDEAPYLQEWIEFHKLQGVEHFYLYNNNSTDHYLTILQPYIERLEVTLTEWPYAYKKGETEEWLAIQRHAYTDCILTHGQDSKWIAFIDIDEFLFCVDGELLPKFLENYRPYGGLCVNWLLFGTSNLDTIPPGVLLIEALTSCSEAEHQRNYQVKSIVQTRHVFACESAYSFTYKKGYYAVNADEQKVSNGKSTYVSHDKIRINHYWTRAEDHFKYKIESRNYRRKRDSAKILSAWNDDYNVSTDSAILQFVPALRNVLNLD